MNIQQAIDKLMLMNDSTRPVLMELWYVEDVEAQCEQGSILLTETEKSRVLELADKNHDATIGINWDVLDYHINQVILERKKG